MNTTGPKVQDHMREAKGRPNPVEAKSQAASRPRSWLRLSRGVSNLRLGTVDRHHAKQGYVDLESGHLSSRVEGLRIGDNGEVHTR